MIVRGRDKMNIGKESIGFESKLWLAADKMRNNMDAAEYKHVVLGLIFLKYISDVFEEKHEILQKEYSDPKSRNYIKNQQERYSTLNDPDEYRADNVFWVPAIARWEHLQKRAKQPDIGKHIDDAMDAIEKDNPKLKGVLPKNYARQGLDKQRLGELIDLIGSIGLGGKDAKSKDILGRVYEYFLGMFADAEGKRGGQFYTTRCVVQLLVKMIEPYKGRVFDPCCGSGGMFVQSEKFVEESGGKLRDIAVYGQESNQTTYKLCVMNLAIRGIEADIKWNNEGSFHRDAHPELKADFILANPPFNMKEWGGESLKDDKRWKYGAPPAGNANYAWVQHFIYHLAPTGIAGFVMANGSLSSNTSGEGDIRKNIVEAGILDCIVALPGQLFYNTMIPVCLWFISRDKKNNRFRNRKDETLFIDARESGEMIDRRHKELTVEDIQKISDTYHNWRNLPAEAAAQAGKDGKYEDVPGFCKSATLEEIRKHGHILTPGRYVGLEEEEDDGIEFEAKMKKLTSELKEQFKESKKLEAEIKKNLKGIGYEI